MDIRIIQATSEHLTACKDALLNSEVGKLYFSDERATSFLREGIEKGEIFVALSEVGNSHNRGDENFTDKNFAALADQTHTPSIGECLGYIWFSLCGTFYAFPYVRNLMVREEYRSLGVGNALLAYFEKVAFAKSRKVFLLVNEENQRAKQFYVRNGYKEVGYIPDLIRDGLSEFLLMKSRP